jgi:hypothetical protein
MRNAQTWAIATRHRAVRDYYAGRACERLSCPTSGLERDENFGAASAITVGAAGGAWSSAEFIVTALIHQFPFSGHGGCKSMREASQEFNGRTLTKAKTTTNAGR